MDVLASRFIVHPPHYDESVRFYRDVLGLSIFREYQAGTVFYAGGGLIELADHGTPSSPDSSHSVSILLQVPDVYEAERILRENGGVIERGAQEEPWGLHELRIRDPQGISLVLVHIPEGHPQRGPGKKSSRKE